MYFRAWRGTERLESWRLGVAYRLVRSRLSEEEAWPNFQPSGARLKGGCRER